MKREYKIGDWVIFIDKEQSDLWKRAFRISLYKKIAKIIYIEDTSSPHLLEFRDWINGHNGLEGKKGKEGHCCC